MKKLIMLLTVTLTATLTGCGFEIVGTGHRGVQVTLGKVTGEPLSEGLYFYNPFTSSIIEYSVQQETWQSKTAVFTKDTQRTDIAFAVTYSADPSYVGDLYKTFGRENDLENKIIKPVVVASIKDSIGQLIADELVGKREAVTKETLRKVQENLKERHVLVSDLQFTNLDFDDAYEKAVEQKVVAIQHAQMAKNKTVQVEEEAKQTVKTAEAQATAMKIQSAALSTNKGLVQYELAKKWNGVLPQMMFGSSTPLINMSDLGKDK